MLFSDYIFGWMKKNLAQIWLFTEKKFHANLW
jgi:hypothetical protein